MKTLLEALRERFPGVAMEAVVSAAPRVVLGPEGLSLDPAAVETLLVGGKEVGLEWPTGGVAADAEVLYQGEKVLALDYAAMCIEPFVGSTGR